MSPRPVRVLLLWPGCEGAAGGNFGVPQLVLLASYARRETGAAIDIRDLAGEAALGQTSWPALLEGGRGGYDVIGFSVYSSYDHLKCEALAAAARALYPDAVIVAGGYHPSARPEDYVYPGSPFDVAVIGEGERPLVEVIESVAGGAPLRQRTLGPLALDDLSVLPPSDWSFLERYRPVARRFASQAQVYLSRGCPYDCAFCMERVKRETSWRPLPVERALEEVAALHRFLDLDGWTLYVGDALFGMKQRWRREFLDGLARLGLPLRKVWFLIRVDLVDEEDLRLFQAANCSPGFGLESGDEGQLKRIRKSGRLDGYLERMREIAAKARELQVPWGANVICGHPGETRESMVRSAAYLRELFADPRGTTGFLSVDPFRLYPGSPIDAERERWEREHGTRFWRPEWWQDGDQEFLSEWVDPSRELSYREREALQHELLLPILRQVEGNFVYRGPARDYYLRAIRDQVDFHGARTRLHFMGRYYAWQRYLGRGARGRAERREHEALGAVCRELRAEGEPALARLAQVDPGAPVLEALRELPRERFVPLERTPEAVRDQAIPFAPEGSDDRSATLSALHAYARSLDLLGLSPGDTLLDLGAGTGYGAAVAARVAGPEGRVIALELDPALVALGREELAALPEGTRVTLSAADALDPDTWPAGARACRRVVVGFAPQGLPAAWDVFAPGTLLVAPLAEGARQRLSRCRRTETGWEVERLEEVSYVPARRPDQLAPVAPEPRAARELPLAPS